MLEDNPVDPSATSASEAEPAKAPRKRATKKAAAASAPEIADAAGAATEAPAKKAPAKKAATTTAKASTTKKAAAKKSSTTKKAAAAAPDASEAGVDDAAPSVAVKKTTRKSPAAKKAAAEPEASGEAGEAGAPGVLFQPPAATRTTTTRRTRKAASSTDEAGSAGSADEGDTEASFGDEGDETGEGGARRRRRRGGRRRRRSGEDAGADGEGDEQSDDEAAGDEGGEGTSRRRRRRRRSGEDAGDTADDPQNTVTRVRRQRTAEDEITSISGSTRLEAKKQRRRDGREAGRRRAPIVSEAEFLARRESVERVMVIRQRDDITQIGVLEDKVLVEHYVARESQVSIIGNVYLGRVQNVLPSMEAAFIDIGKGRNAVLYAGEVNWSALGHKEGQPRKIESVLTSGQPILVQVTKDPIGQKGARLTSQISLAGRFLVYVPDGTTSGISRRLPDTERNRLKTLLKEIVPESAGVIVRTAAEGASEEELTRDVERLKARWEDIEGKLKGNAPQLLYGEPDLTLKVVRDLFTEDFTKLVIQGDDVWDTVEAYVRHVAPDLEERLERYDPTEHDGRDSFAAFRIDEQIAKGLDRKVWLPSGGSLVIDRTEAMTVVDVNTGKFTGSGGNLEETVTKNNLEAAEEVVRQLRLRDIGGIIVIDFIDMVLESNRDLVLRRLVECLGRDRTRHQVAEVTSLGLVQMTRKRIGTGLLETFSEPCAHCQGRGVLVHEMPVDPGQRDDDSRRGEGRRGRGRGKDTAGKDTAGKDSKDSKDTKDGKEAKEAKDSSGGRRGKAAVPSPTYVASVARPDHPADEQRADEESAEAQSADALPVERTQPEPEATADVAPGIDAGGDDATLAEFAGEEPPLVVTRVRRGASRPVTTPVSSETTEPVVEPAPMAEEATADEETAPAAPPRVVTRTRGRSATRPAGPPEEGAGGATIEHVPIKRKGSRKR